MQLHLDILYESNPKTALLFKIKWGDPIDRSFFQMVKSTLAYKIVKNLPIAKVDVRVEET